MNDPQLYLAVDNCFASKRWTTPSEWARLIQRMGVQYVEASADTECDPLYMGEAYLRDWKTELQRACEHTGVRVANLYSGHGTYSTLGLAHTDSRVRHRMQRQWLEPMAELAGEIGAGIGFYCHAFPNEVLQNNALYQEYEQRLYNYLAEIATYAKQAKVRNPGVEQMYTPHQIPWTIEGAVKLLREVYALSLAPFYITLDTGHQSGQIKFVRPAADSIAEAANMARRGQRRASFWLGPQTAYRLFGEMLEHDSSREASYIELIEQEMAEYPYLFAQDMDGDTYAWIEKLAVYSPIIHLQQTNGKSSSHQPFTDEFNRDGIVDGMKVLEAIDSSYRQPVEQGMPPRVRDIYLTLEIFSGTSEMNVDIVHKMERSVQYWRQFVPRDGMKLSEALALIEGRTAEVGERRS